MQRRYETMYGGHRLIVIEPPTGGYQIEIVHVAGGRSVLTSVFGQLAYALASARKIIDHQNRVLH